METLSQDTLTWARRIGLSTDRIAFLLACPKHTISRQRMTYARRVSMSPDRYIMKSGSKYYFRVHSHTGKATVVLLGQDIAAARLRRDELLALHYANKVPA